MKKSTNNFENKRSKLSLEKIQDRLSLKNTVKRIYKMFAICLPNHVKSYPEIKHHEDQGQKIHHVLLNARKMIAPI